MAEQEIDEPMKEASESESREGKDIEENLDKVMIHTPHSSIEQDASQAQIVVSGGRRRGRRRTLKKKTVKDEEGYLGNEGCNLITCLC